MRRTPLVRMGDDRVARNVPRRRGPANPQHHARHRRHQPSVPPSVQRGTAHRAARPHEPRSRDVRVGSGGSCLRRAHAHDRSDGAARPSGRGPVGDHPTAARRRPLQLRVRVVQAQRCSPPAPPPPGGPPNGDRVVDLAVGHDTRRQVRHGRALDRVELDGGNPGPADAVELRRGRGGRTRPDRRPQELAGDARVPHRRVA